MRYIPALLATAWAAKGLDLNISLANFEAELEGIATEVEEVALNALATVEHYVEPEELAETAPIIQ